jgi:peptidoglycan/LPS O-acetylase OafA/YrhL
VHTTARLARPLQSVRVGRLYRPDVEGLRGVAILSVILYHAGVPFIPGGFTGVDIFFVISGYLIGGHIHAELRAGSFSFLRFYQRRAKRILPAFFAALAFILLVSLFLLSPMEAVLTARSGFAATLSASNIFFWITANYFSPRAEMNPLLMTWSLGVEEQFYAVIPVLLVLIARLRRDWLLPAILSACALSLFLSGYLVGRSPMLVFYLLPARAWELGAGVALAVAEINRQPRSNPAPVTTHSAARGQWLSFAGVALVLAPMFLLTYATPFPGPAALPTVAGAAALIATPASWINRRLLPWRPLNFVGKISYSWYLIHWPLLAFLRIVYGGNPPPADLLATAAASFPLAILSYYFIEQPFRRSQRPAIPMLLSYAGIGIGALAVCSAIWVTHGLSRRYPALATMEFTERPLQSDLCLVRNNDQPNLSPACYDISQSYPSVAIWGDSHAAAMAPALRSAAAARGYALFELAKSSCPPLTGATHYFPPEPTRAAACTRFNRKALALLESDRNVGIVILTASWAAPFNRNWADGWLAPDDESHPATPSLERSRRLFTQSLTETILALLGAGKRVIVVQDTPYFAFDPIFRVRAAQIPARHALALWLRAPDAADPGYAAPVIEPSIPLSVSLIDQVTGSLAGVELFDPVPALCANANQCAYRDDTGPLFIDNSHLSAAGARRALRALPLPSL